MDDIQHSILRIETTINNPAELKSYRAVGHDPPAPKSWRGLRKRVADLHRRAHISQKSNERYLDALAADTGHRTHDLVQELQHKGSGAA